MSIVTQTILEDRVGAAELVRLTDDARTGAVDTSVLARISADGEAEILARVGQRYTLPLGLTDAVTAAVVTSYCADVIVYRLYLHRDRTATEDLATAYKMALAWADKVAGGTLSLTGETEPGDDEDVAGGFVIEARERTMSRENMEGL